MAYAYILGGATFRRLPEFLSDFGPGVLVSLVVALAALFLSEYYGAPAMLMALLLGIAFNFFAEEGRCVQGIGLASKTVLQIGVALLGARISVELLIGLGPGLIALVGVICTILFGLAGARLLGRGWRLALLTGGAVAICRASAAMAIAAVPPKNEHSERNLIFTVLGVTVLSTLAMIAYSIITEALDLDDLATGVFLGGTIHDVAQVVGAGFSVSDQTGETVTPIKLIRVSMWAPVVLVFSLVIRATGEAATSGTKRPALVPGFVVAFLIFARVNSLGVIPQLVAEGLGELSRWMLLVAIAAVGMKTSLRRILEVGGQAITLFVAETVFIAGLILIGIVFLA